MDDSALAPVATVLKDSTVEENSRLGWVEKHSELIAKLEAEYQQPKGVVGKKLAERYYTFSNSDLNILVPSDVSSEVLEQSSIHQIPLAPAWLLGACNVRGDIVPIIDLSKIIGNKKTELSSKPCRTLILGSADNFFGILVDELPKPVQFKKNQQVSEYSNIPDVLKPYIRIVYKKYRKLWLCIDFQSLITSFSNK